MSTLQLANGYSLRITESQDKSSQIDLLYRDRLVMWIDLDDGLVTHLSNKSNSEFIQPKTDISARVAEIDYDASRTKHSVKEFMQNMLVNAFACKSTNK